MPFTKTAASADTCVVTDFYAASRLDLLWRLFPDGLWLDASVLLELHDMHGENILQALSGFTPPHRVEKHWEDSDYELMRVIKSRHRALTHPDIASVVLAHKYGIACLSSDAALFKTCGEYGVPAVRHVGLLDESISRHLIVAKEALTLLDGFVADGLFLPIALIEERRQRWSGS